MVFSQRIADVDRPSSLVMDSGDIKLLTDKKTAFLESVLETRL
jgi:hypothetical protein